MVAADKPAAQALNPKRKRPPGGSLLGLLQPAQPSLASRHQALKGPAADLPRFLKEGAPGKRP